ncbi:MAG: tetratricopeptide repeat protein [Planctomycetota bacterium]
METLGRYVEIKFDDVNDLAAQIAHSAVLDLLAWAHAIPAKSNSEKQTIRVFIASPGDLAVERRAFKDMIEELNNGFGDGAGKRFEALGWEDTLASTGRRSQSVINQEVDRSDIFVLVMHRRWGQEAPDAKPYSSYTEEEFHRAYDRWKNTASPEIFVFFKHIDSGQMADAGPQLQKVLDFRKSLEESRLVLYHGFADEQEFKSEVNRHLRAFAKGELPKIDTLRDTVVLPLAIIEEVKKERAEKEQALSRAEREHQIAEAAVARAEKLALEFAERAAKAAVNGRAEEARQDFAKATDGTTNLQVLHLAYDFYERMGDLATAEEMLERWLGISGRAVATAETTTAMGNLGVIYLKRGKLGRAEEMFKKALAIDEQAFGVEHPVVARDLNNLAQLFQGTNRQGEAEPLVRRMLAIDEQTYGADHPKVARNLNNLVRLLQVANRQAEAEVLMARIAAISYGNDQLNVANPIASSTMEVEFNVKASRQRITAAWVIKAKEAEGRYDVFLSHNSKDKAEVEKIARRLKEVGIRPWLDDWDLVPGQTITDALSRAIITIPCAALFFGTADVGNWHIMEIRHYVAKWANGSGRIVPTILPGVNKIPELPPFVGQTLWVDMREWEQKGNDGFYRLVCGIIGRRPGDSPLSSFNARNVWDWQQE